MAKHAFGGSPDIPINLDTDDELAEAARRSPCPTATEPISPSGTGSSAIINGTAIIDRKALSHRAAESAKSPSRTLETAFSTRTTLESKPALGPIPRLGADATPHFKRRTPFNASSAPRNSTGSSPGAKLNGLKMACKTGSESRLPTRRLDPPTQSDHDEKQMVAWQAPKSPPTAPERSRVPSSVLSTPLSSRRTSPRVTASPLKQAVFVDTCDRSSLSDLEEVARKLLHEMRRDHECVMQVRTRALVSLYLIETCIGSSGCCAL